MEVLKAAALQFGEFFFSKRNKKDIPVECEDIDMRQAVAVAGANTQNC
jgi:hypothetical protein